MTASGETFGNQRSWALPRGTGVLVTFLAAFGLVMLLAMLMPQETGRPAPGSTLHAASANVG